VRGALTGRVGPTKNQGTQGSCDGHMSSEIGERLYLRWKPQVPFVQFSPAFAYAQERILEGTFSQGDVGATIESAVATPDPRAVGGYGFCPLSVMPYDANVCDVAPGAKQIAYASGYPGGAFHSLGNNLANIKSCILSDYTFGIGIQVYDSFESDETASTGLVPYPDVNSENLLGGHALHAGIGYDDDIQCPNSPNPGAVLIMNSWGPWGIACPVVSISTDPGFAWLSYDYLLNPNLTSDIRLGHLGPRWMPKAA
jgi:hypothetical protein